MMNPSPAASGPLDRAVLENLIESLSAEGVVEVIDAYLAEETKLLNGLKDALARKDAKTLTRHAHSLKSTSAMLGASALARVCEELENGVRAGKLDHADRRIKEIEAAYLRVKAELQAERSRLKR